MSARTDSGPISPPLLDQGLYARQLRRSQPVRPPQFRPALSDDPDIVVSRPVTPEPLPAAAPGEFGEAQPYGHRSCRIDGFLPGQVSLHLTRGLEPMDPGEHVLFFHPCRHPTDTEGTRYRLRQEAYSVTVAGAQRRPA